MTDNTLQALIEVLTEVDSDVLERKVKLLFNDTSLTVTVAYEDMNEQDYEFLKEKVAQEDHAS